MHTSSPPPPPPPASCSSPPICREEQLQLLRELKQNPSISIRAMARETDLTTGCVRRLLKKLEQEETREGSALKRFQELSAEEQKHIVQWWLARNAQEEELSAKSLNGKTLLWRRVRQTNHSNNNNGCNGSNSSSDGDLNKRKVELQQQEEQQQQEGYTPWPPAKRKVPREQQHYPSPLHTTHTLQPSLHSPHNPPPPPPPPPAAAAVAAPSLTF